jgi:hypothetical protein
MGPCPAGTLRRRQVCVDWITTLGGFWLQSTWALRHRRCLGAAGRHRMGARVAQARLRQGGGVLASAPRFGAMTPAKAALAFRICSVLGAIGLLMWVALWLETMRSAALPLGERMWLTSLRLYTPRPPPLLPRRRNAVSAHRGCSPSSGAISSSHAFRGRVGVQGGNRGIGGSISNCGRTTTRGRRRFRCRCTGRARTRLRRSS